jgi:hypothetical protein
VTAVLDVVVGHAVENDFVACLILVERDESMSAFEVESCDGIST